LAFDAMKSKEKSQRAPFPAGSPTRQRFSPISSIRPAAKVHKARTARSGIRSLFAMWPTSLKLPPCSRNGRIFRVRNWNRKTSHKGPTRKSNTPPCFNGVYKRVSVCREFACNFASLDGSEQTVDWSEDLGMMLYDVRFPVNGAPQPGFFQASIKDGVLHCDTVDAGANGDPPITVIGWDTENAA
jgi:hypothetical protein